MQDQIHESAYRHQMEIEENERRVVGLNVFEEDEEDPISVPSPDFSGLEQDQKRRLEEFKARRDTGEYLASARRDPVCCRVDRQSDASNDRGG